MDCNDRLHEGIRLHHTQINLESTQILRYQSRVHQPIEKIYKDHKGSVQTDVESNMFEIKKGTKQGDALSSLLFNTVLQNSLKDVTQRGQKEKGMGIYLRDHDHDCLTNRGSPTTCFCSLPPKKRFKNVAPRFLEQRIGLGPKED